MVQLYLVIKRFQIIILFSKNLSDTAIEVVKNRVGKKEAKKIKLLYDILPYVAPKTFSDPNGKKSIQVGAKSETAFELPLAIKGAVTYMLKSTVFKNNLGKVIMCGYDGLMLDGHLDNIPNLEDNYYLNPPKNIVIVKQYYEYNKKLRTVISIKKEIVTPKHLNLF